MPVYCLHTTPRHVTEFVRRRLYWTCSINFRACANGVYQALLSPPLEPGNEAISGAEDELALVFCGVYCLWWPRLGLCVLLQSFHHASSAGFGEKFPRGGPCTWISKRSLSVARWSLVLRSIWMSFSDEKILSAWPFGNGRLKHRLQSSRTLCHLLASGQTYHSQLRGRLVHTWLSLWSGLGGQEDWLLLPLVALGKWLQWALQQLKLQTMICHQENFQDPTY